MIMPGKRNPGHVWLLAIGLLQVQSIKMQVVHRTHCHGHRGGVSTVSLESTIPCQGATEIYPFVEGTEKCGRKDISFFFWFSAKFHTCTLRVES